MVDLTNLGTRRIGYPFAANDEILISGELMNMLDAEQEVEFSMTWEYIPKTPKDFAQATPYWLDIGGCESSDLPAQDDTQFEYSSPPVQSDFHAEIVFIGGHLHDGGTRLEVLKDDIPICSSYASYSAASPLPNHGSHISAMQSCHNVGTAAPGQQWSVRAHYNTAKHPPMKSNDGSLEPVMGIALVYAVTSAPISHTLSRREVLIFVIVAAVVASGAAALFLARKYTSFDSRSVRRTGQKGWQRVETDDFDDDETDEASMGLRDDLQMNRNLPR
jgi:hypothetical protein